MREFLKNSQKIVIKVGTSILTSKRGRISKRKLTAVCEQVRALIQAKKQPVLVSSGAIAFGMETVGLKQRPKKMARLQACASIGQSKLMHAYEQAFSRHGIVTSQLLLTRDGLENRDRFLTARHTFEELSSMKVVPIINENDTVSTHEIAFGDNDVLSVQVAHLIHADLLILLSDVDGFFLKDGSRIREVGDEGEIDRNLIAHLKDRQTQNTVGGMKAKLASARLAMRLGVPMMIVNGHDSQVIQKAISGEDVGTLFSSSKKKRSARKKWIAFSAKRAGAVVIDEGAYQALLRNSSLLPRGMTRVEGPFDRGQVVELRTKDGKVVGRGVARYSSQDLARLIRKKTSEIEKILGVKAPDEVIHRNDLVIWS